MAFEYFLYDTNYNNTLVDRSNNSFAPLPPNTGEIFINFLIPTTQPLYYYRESGGTIVLNDQATIDAYLYETNPPTLGDSTPLGVFTGYSATTDVKIENVENNKINIVTGATGNLGVFLPDGNLIDTGIPISGLTGGTDGEIENPLYAFSRTEADGTVLSSFNISINKAGTGVYDYTFDSPLLDVNYGIFAQPIETTTDTNTQISNITASGFRVSTGVGDNGTTPDILTDTDHSLAIFGVPISGATGIPVVSLEQFTGYTGTTDVRIDNIDNNKVNRSGDTITGDLKVEGSLFVTGTSATTGQLENAVLLGGLTTDGRIVATNTPALNVSEEVTDISSGTTITNLSGIYYVDTTSGNVTLQVPDASAENDVSRLTILKKSPDANLVLVATTGGTQLIGDATTQTIGQPEKGITIVSDADNSKWLITADSRFPTGNDAGTLLYWNDVDKLWESTTNDVTWDNVNLKFTVGGNSSPQTFQVDATEDIVYINSTGLTGLVGADDLGFYAGGRGAFGNAVTLDRLRANTPSNEPRSLSLVDTNAVMRVWRYVNDGGDPAVEFIWGTGSTAASVGNAWWDMFLDGAASPNDTFAIRRRTENNSDKILTVAVDGVETPFKISVGQKFNMTTGYTNTNLTDGDLWADDSLYFRSGDTTYNLIPATEPLKSVQVRQSTQVNNIPTTWTDFNWNSTDIENDNTVVEHDNTNTDRVYVYEDGLYFISYQYQIDDESSTRVRINDTTVINGSETTADATALSLPVSKSFLVNLTAGDFVTMQTLGLANGQDIDAGATMIVVKFDGLKGDKGDTGSGGGGISGITLQENNVNVPNTPHDTINFDSNFTVTDNGSSKATVSLSDGIGSAKLCELSDTVGGQEMTNITPVAMNWDTQEFLDTNYFSHTISGSVITVLQTGLYEISYNVNGANQTNGRSTTGVQVRKNGTLVGKTLSANYSRNTSNNDNHNSIPPTSISMNANDTFDVVIFRLGDNNSTLTKAGASFVRIKYMGT